MERIFRTNPDTMKVSGRKISGTAIVFDQWSNDLGGFIEIIKRDALDWKTVKKSDIVATMDHRLDYILARSRKNNKGNLTLTLDEIGLHFEFEAPNTAKGDEIISHIERGEYDACSFCFSWAVENGDEWVTDGLQLKHIVKKITALYDVSIVAYPAYSQTSVDVRSRSIIDTVNNLNSLENEIEQIYETAKIG